MMVFLVAFKINLLCDKKQKGKQKIAGTVTAGNHTHTKVDEDITLNKYLVQKEYEFKQQGYDPEEIKEQFFELAHK